MAIAPFLFILVTALCEFAIVQGVYILLRSQEEEAAHCSSWGHRWTHLAVHSSKRFRSCLTSYDYAKVVDEIKKQKQGIQLCYGVCNETK